MRKFALIVFFFNIPALAAAQGMGTYYNGNGMLEQCRNPSSPISFWYAAGVKDALSALRAVDPDSLMQNCSSLSVTAGQARDVMCKYIEDNPDSRTDAAAALAWVAFHEAWPCPN